MPQDDATPPRVTVLMAIHQGARFLPEQLDSIAAQEGIDWRLVVSDDGSTDGGPGIVRDFAAAHPGRVARRNGPRRGAAANFRALMADAGGAGFTALADQDDRWHAGKLARAAAALRAVPEGVPAIWCSRVVICDASLAPRGLSRLPRAAPSFRHALVQNMVQGNTLMMNRAALALMRAADRLAGPVVMHDWWTYQIVSGAGGRVIFDARPSVDYRQHGANAVGSDGPRAQIARMLRGRHAEWSRLNLAALTACAPLLTAENRALLAEFARLLNGSPAQRLAAMRRGGFHRHGAFSQAALWVAAALGRV